MVDTTPIGTKETVVDSNKKPENEGAIQKNDTTSEKTNSTNHTLNSTIITVITTENQNKTTVSINETGIAEKKDQKPIVTTVQQKLTSQSPAQISETSMISENDENADLANNVQGDLTQLEKENENNNEIDQEGVENPENPREEQPADKKPDVTEKNKNPIEEKSEHRLPEINSLPKFFIFLSNLCF